MYSLEFLLPYTIRLPAASFLPKRPGLKMGFLCASCMTEDIYNERNYTDVSYGVHVPDSFQKKKSVSLVLCQLDRTFHEQTGTI